MVNVAQIWRYPVKSLGGERLDRVGCSRRGIDHDRRWAVRGADGKFGSGKTTRRFRRMPGLLALSARVGEDGTARILFPDGSEVPATDSRAAARLSSVVGEPVTVAEEIEVSHFDDSPLHLVSTGSLRRLGAEADPRSRWGASERYRPNLVLDSGDEPGIENDWIGRRLRVGQLLVEVEKSTERCVMVTLGQGDVPVARHLLSHLAGNRDGCFGVYARVLSSGTISVGDQVTDDSWRSGHDSGPEHLLRSERRREHAPSGSIPTRLVNGSRWGPSTLWGPGRPARVSPCCL